MVNDTTRFQINLVLKNYLKIYPLFFLLNQYIKKRELKTLFCCYTFLLNYILASNSAFLFENSSSVKRPAECKSPNFLISSITSSDLFL